MQAVSLRRQFWALAIPNMLAGSAEPLAAIVSLGFLGHLADIIPLAGVVLAAVIFEFLYWGCAFIRFSTTGLTAQALGADDREEQAALLWRAMLMAVVLGALFYLCRDPIADAAFSILDGGPEVEAAGRLYYDARILGGVPVLLVFATWAWLLGQQRSDLTLWGAAVFAVVNVAADYWFIIHRGMGAEGAGLAIVLADIATFLTNLIFIAYHWGGMPRFDRRRVLNWPKMQQIIALSSSIAIRNVLLLCVFAGFVNLSAGYGTVVLAANSLLLRLFYFTACFLDGMAIALESMVGKFLGAGKNALVKMSLKLATISSLLCAVAWCAVLLAVQPWLLPALTDHPGIIMQANAAMLWMCACTVLGAFAFVYDGLFFGLARPKPLLISIVVAGGAFVVCAFLADWLEQAWWLWAGMTAFVALRGLSLRISWLNCRNALGAA